MNTAAAPQRIGILIVGLAGHKGQRLIQGYAAHKNGTQPFEIEGAEEHPLASDAAIGGWDIRPMNTEVAKVQVFQGIQDDDASLDNETNETTLFDKVQRLRQDITTFIHDNHVDGHTTVIWSAGKEEPAIQFADSAALLRAILTNSTPVPPCQLYAVAAALQGCSFVVDDTSHATAASLLFHRSYRIMQPCGLLKRFPNASGLPAYFVNTNDESSVATMVHVALWCDFFARHHVPNPDVAKAFKYYLTERVDKDGFERQIRQIQERGVHAR